MLLLYALINVVSVVGIIDQKNDRAEKCQALSNMEDRIVCRIEASR